MSTPKDEMESLISNIVSCRYRDGRRADTVGWIVCAWNDSLVNLDQMYSLIE